MSSCDDIAFDEAFERMNNRIRQSIDGESYVVYSAYDTNDDDIPIDNLDELAIEGNVRFYQRYNAHWDSTGKGQDYKSHVIKDPTWLDVAKLCNEMIKITGDKTHVFLEGIHYGRQEQDYMLISFTMGS